MLREAADIGGALSGRPGAWHVAETTAVFYFGLGVRWSGWPGLARHLKPPTVGSALIAAQSTAVRASGRSPGPAGPRGPCPQASPAAACRVCSPTRAPQPLVFFLWRHRKCHLLLRKITAFGWIELEPRRIANSYKCPWRSWVIVVQPFICPLSLRPSGAS